MDSDNSDAQTEMSVKDLEDIIKKHETWISNVFNKLGWEKNKTQMENKNASCRLDSSHRMPEYCIHKHESICELKKRGYSKKEIIQIISNFKNNRDLEKNIELENIEKIIRNNQPDIIVPPYGISQLLNPPGGSIEQHLSRQTRLSLYENSTKKFFKNTSCNLDLNIKKSNASNFTETDIEIVAKERDAKRRPQSYKKKTILSGKRSYTEEIRDLIRNQSEELTEDENKMNDY